MNHILKTVDHTLLKPTATWEEIKVICDEAKEMKVASICIPPSFVKQASDYLKGEVAVCTVIGFPLGYNTTAIKVAEVKDALANGADEVDMVINIGDAKAGKFDKIEQEIKALKEAAGDKILKVIIETCYLTEDEKIALCKAVTNAKADFIKTSTGFGTNGATLEDIKLMKQNVGQDVAIKAAGGVRSIEDANNFINAGASRLGTSSICQIIKNQQVTGY
ncbi:deoxyribose-phosphate aldolase [Candidatus Epulonipiscium fishelsonii]|uniref:Deoxyribose-phosphate aldolase n=1 Tax=Candidatus Epulonipiscium fishelsonii TaxID=77094 RepID=A0ACC8XB67_9FIRM|nr:deoxyribose-phosphate aldolase [Epulopiscium sp. SCG-B11WGA-EpuloA1]ONI42001.1 deoxyribose-phosphate aldolase [Epulopiscium sp. SCG-B05WGA-EpuloA1]